MNDIEQVNLIPATINEAAYLVDVSQLAPLPEAQQCLYCKDGEKERDVYLLTHGWKKTSETYKQTYPELLQEHYGHLTRADRYIDFLKQSGTVFQYSTAPTPEKLTWIQASLYKMYVAAETGEGLFSLTKDIGKSTIAKTKIVSAFTKLNIFKADLLREMLKAVSLEADMSGFAERNKMRARLAAEKDHQLDEDLMTEDQKVEVARALLRQKGYQVTRKTQESEG